MSEYIDNQNRRKQALKEVIRQLHDGAAVDEVKQQFSALLEDVGASEIAEIEQALISEGLPETEVKRLCDVHVAAFRDSLEAQLAPETIAGHPLHTFRAENEAAGEILDDLEAAIAGSDWDQAKAYLERLQEYEKHYARKENILFPYLEKHGFSGPTTVMWAIHDDIRAGWKQLERQIASISAGENQEAVAQISGAFEVLATAIREMFYKEEHILLPTAIEKLSDEEWLAIRRQEPELGYSYVQPGNQWPGAAYSTASDPAVVRQDASTANTLAMQTGALTLDQINNIFTHLPLDITFVDENDTVRFFSQTKERIFDRTPAIIGRKVQACHPPTSVHHVQHILDDFRAGRRDVAEFWIQMQGKFIHIRYFAVRNEADVYQGTIELTQEISDLRTLEGERRLLDEGE